MAWACGSVPSAGASGSGVHCCVGARKTSASRPCPKSCELSDTESTVAARQPRNEPLCRAERARELLVRRRRVPVIVGVGTPECATTTLRRLSRLRRVHNHDGGARWLVGWRRRVLGRSCRGAVRREVGGGTGVVVPGRAGGGGGPSLTGVGGSREVGSGTGVGIGSVDLLLEVGDLTVQVRELALVLLVLLFGGLRVRLLLLRHQLALLIQGLLVRRRLLLEQQLELLDFLLVKHALLIGQLLLLLHFLPQLLLLPTRLGLQLLQLTCALAFHILFLRLQLTEVIFVLLVVLLGRGFLGSDRAAELVILLLNLPAVVPELLEVLGELT
eukprot:Hpha_TRINITY_DN15202_c0_g4::TRINITY_DN15202_c0_g4_i1::g.66953::m.66953